MLQMMQIFIWLHISLNWGMKNHALESILLQIAILYVFCTQRMTQILNTDKHNTTFDYYNLRSAYIFLFGIEK